MIFARRQTRPPGLLDRLRRTPLVARAIPTQVTGGSLTGAHAIGVRAIGPSALGPLAVAVCAVGAIAIGRVAIGRAVIRVLKAGEVEIDSLRVGRLEVAGQAWPPAS